MGFCMSRVFSVSVCLWVLLSVDVCLCLVTGTQESLPPPGPSLPSPPAAVAHHRRVQQLPDDPAPRTLHRRRDDHRRTGGGRNTRAIEFQGVRLFARGQRQQGDALWLAHRCTDGFQRLSYARTCSIFHLFCACNIFPCSPRPFFVL